ncbi:MAG: hypothetical protein ACI9TH_004801 [Kiritimatiellia bacterium]|jgi:hypothetical protein
MKMNYVVSVGIALLSTVWVQAQTVYSVNVVGFQKLQIPPGGFAFSSTPFDAGTNTLNGVIGKQGEDIGLGNGDSIFTWDGVGYKKFVRFPETGADARDGLWVDASFTIATNDIATGTGFIYQNKQATTQEIVVVGEVLDDTQNSLAVPAGLSLLSYSYSSDIPLNGTSLTNLATQADEIFVFDTASQGYQKYTYFANVGDPVRNFKWLDAGFLPTDLVLETGNSFFYRNKAAGFVWTEDLPYDLQGN